MIKNFELFCINESKLKRCKMFELKWLGGQ